MILVQTRSSSLDWGRIMRDTSLYLNQTDVGRQSVTSKHYSSVCSHAEHSSGMIARRLLETNCILPVNAVNAVSLNEKQRVVIYGYFGRHVDIDSICMSGRLGVQPFAGVVVFLARSTGLQEWCVLRASCQTR